MPDHWEYRDLFRNLGKYGALSAEEWVLSMLCTHYRTIFLDYFKEPHSTGCEWDAEYNSLRVKNENNKTFSERLEPFIKNIGENIDGNLCERLNNWHSTTRWDRNWHNKTRYEKVENWLGHQLFRGRLDRGIEDLKKDVSQHFKRLLKSTNTDGKWKGSYDRTEYRNNKALIFYAIDSVFESGKVNLYELLELHLRHENNDAKEMLKMVLTKYISTYLTKDRITCYLLFLTKNRLLDVTPQNNIQNSLVRDFMDTHTSVLDQYGTIPYVDLAHAVVEELDQVNIAAVINTQYRNFVKIMGWFNKVNWKGEFEAVENRISSTLTAPVLMGIYCKSKNRTRTDGIGQIIRSVNISSSGFDDDLLYIVNRLSNFFSLVLEKMKSDIFPVLDLHHSSPVYLADYIERNKGIIKKVLHYKLNNDVGHIIGAALIYIVDTYNEIIATMKQEQVFESLSNLSQAFSYTTQDKEEFLKPIIDFGKFLSCLYCHSMLKIFKVEVPCTTCVP